MFFALFPHSLTLSLTRSLARAQTDRKPSCLLSRQHIGGECTLAPGETRCVAYRGHWCIRIVGPADALQVIEHSTNNGRTRNANDDLGMAANVFM